MDCISNYQDYLQYYEPVIDQINKEFNRLLVFNQIIQIEGENQQIVNTEANRNYREAHQRKIKAEKYNKIMQLLSQQELNKKVLQLPILPLQLPVQNYQVLSVNDKSYLFRCFNGYIQNGKVTYNEQTGEFETADKAILKKLQQLSEANFPFYTEVSKISETSFQVDQFKNAANSQKLRSIDFIFRGKDGNLSVILKHCGFPAFLCHKMIQKYEIMKMRIKLTQADDQEEIIADLELEVKDITSEYIICDVRRCQDFYDKLQFIEQFIYVSQEQNGQLSGFSKQQKELTGLSIFRGYETFEPNNQLSAEISLLQTDEILKRIQLAVTYCKYMDQGKNYNKKSDEDKNQFNNQQLISRQYLIKNVLYSGEDNNINYIPSKQEQYLNSIQTRFCLTLTQQQREIINEVMSHRVTAINGVPSSGKSTLASILALLTSQTSGKTLLTSKSNKSADLLTKMVLRCCKPGEVVRLYGITQQKIINTQDQKDQYYLDIEHCTLQQLIINQITEQNKDLGNDVEVYLKQRSAFEDINKQSASYQEITDSIQKYTKDIIEKAKIIILTPVTSYDERLSNIFFDNVIVDNCQQFDLGESLVCLSKAITRYVIIGDLQQQQFFKKGQNIASTNYNESMLKRLQCINFQQFYTLQQAFRQSHQIVQLLNNKLYNKQIILPPDQDLLPHLTEQAIDKKYNQSLVLIDSVTEIILSEKSQSNYSAQEAIYVKKIAQWLINQKVNPQDIAIVTTELQQELQIKQMLAMYDLQNIRILSPAAINSTNCKILLLSTCVSGQQVTPKSQVQDAGYLRRKLSQQTLKMLFSRSRQQIFWFVDVQLCNQINYLKGVVQEFIDNGIVYESKDL